MTQYIDKAALVAEIKDYISNYKEIVAKTSRNDSTWVDSVSMIDAKIDVLQHVLFFLDTLEVKEVKEEPVSEDLEEAVENYAATGEVLPNGKVMINFQAEKAFRAGAKWQKEHLIDKACEWLSNISLEDMEYKYDAFDTSEGWYKFIEDFRKYMSL